MSQRSRIVLLLCFAMLLGGCDTVGPWEVWISTASPVPTSGPLIAGNARPPVLARHTMVLSPYDNPYTYAFTDSTGRKVNVFDTLLTRLDAYSERIEPLKQWITKAGTQEFRQGQPYPFTMFLLTISPEVVLVVPNKDKSRGKLCDTLLLQGCLQSQSFRGGAYWFRGSPRIAKGSYWFSPSEGNATIHRLDASAESAEIEVGEATLSLSKSNGEWLVERIR